MGIIAWLILGALAGWIANQVDATMACVQDNIAALRAKLGIPLLGSVPYLAVPDATGVAGMLTLPDDYSSQHGRQLKK